MQNFVPGTAASAGTNMVLPFSHTRRKLALRKHMPWQRQQTKLEIFRAEPADAESAYAIVSEYYASAKVVARDDREAFLQEYFGPAAGFWMASMPGENGPGEIVGCIALRSLEPGVSAEIKRMYLRPSHRGTGIAQKLLEAAEGFARARGYQWIYLDTSDEMLAAARLYQRNGYLPANRYNSNPQATLFLRKKL